MSKVQEKVSKVQELRRGAERFSKERDDLYIFAKDIEDASIKERFLANIEFYSKYAMPELKMLSEEGEALSNKHQEQVGKKLDTCLGVFENCRIITGLLKKCSKAKGELDEAMKGGHFVLDDNGGLYEEVRRCSTKQERVSSHYSGRKKTSDLSLKGGKVFKELLVGTFVDKEGRTKSWFQLEATPVQRIHHTEKKLTRAINIVLELVSRILTFNKFPISINTFRHLGDWIKYASNKKKFNIGQYGKSIHTDKNPIIVKEEGKTKKQIILMDKSASKKRGTKKGQFVLPRKNKIRLSGTAAARTRSRGRA